MSEIGAQFTNTNNLRLPEATESVSERIAARAGWGSVNQEALYLAERWCGDGTTLSGLLDAAKHIAAYIAPDRQTREVAVSSVLRRWSATGQRGSIEDLLACAADVAGFLNPMSAPERKAVFLGIRSSTAAEREAEEAARCPRSDQEPLGLEPERAAAGAGVS